MENINELVFLKERLDTIQMELSRLIELNNVLSMIQIEKVAGVDMAYWKKKGTGDNNRKSCGSGNYCGS